MRIETEVFGVRRVPILKKDGTPGKRTYIAWDLCEYVPIEYCELCGIAGHTSQVIDTGFWDWHVMEFKGNRPNRELYVEWTHGRLCRKCAWKVGPIWHKQEQVLEINNLIGRLIRECRGVGMKTLTAQNEDLVKDINNFGDARRFILQTMVMLRDGTLPTATGLAIAANMKVVNDNIQAEINAAKLNLIAKERGAEFVRRVEMGKTTLHN